MTNRINIISNSDLKKELLEDVMNRDIEQKFHYLGNGANRYYQWFESKKKKNLNTYLTPQDYTSFFLKNIPLSNNKKIAIISLGCGNSCQEKKLLETLTKENTNFSYFGVDSSSEMLDLAEKNLKDINFNKNFILADITTELFETRMKDLLNNFDQRIFCFLWFTFNNPNQTNITDRLYNLLQNDDFLWLDIGARETINPGDNMRLYWLYEKYLQNEKSMDFYFSPLKQMGVNIKDGKMKLKMISEDVIGTLKFWFYFRMNCNKKFSFENKVLHLWEDQDIDLLYIRIYHLPTLIKFLKSFEFKLVTHKIKNSKDPIPKVQLLLSK